MAVLSRICNDRSEKSGQEAEHMKHSDKENRNSSNSEEVNSSEVKSSSSLGIKMDHQSDEAGAKDGGDPELNNEVKPDVKSDVKPDVNPDERDLEESKKRCSTADEDEQPQKKKSVPENDTTA
jgi:hypothetical protein